jgi:hypothetical protein
MMGRYRPLPKPTAVMSRAAKPMKVFRFRTPAKLYSCETLLERLPQDLQDMAAELGQFIQEERAMVGQRHLARHRHVPPPISPASERVWWKAWDYGFSYQMGRKRVATTCLYGTAAVRRPTLWAKAFKAATVGSAMAGS